MTQVQAGLLRDFDDLSIWEIAHRWHDTDPNLSDPLAPPLPVQDIMRLLSRALILAHFHFVDRYGVMHLNHRGMLPISWYIPRKFRTSDGPEGMFHSDAATKNYAELMDQAEIEKEYVAIYDGLERAHAEKVEPLYEGLENRKFDRDVYENVHLKRGEVLIYCLQQGLNPPRFWYTDDDVAKAGEFLAEDAPDKPENRGPHAIRDQDRERCRTIAATLWLVDPTLSIEAIVKHDAVQRLGNGALYRGRDTLRNWIKDLDPRPPEERTGRPSKKRAQT